MTTKIIKIDNLSKTYRGKKGIRVDALNNLSLEIAKGEVFGFLGPNGAGKSTTIKILMGLIPSTEGTAKINGFDVHCVESRRQVGFLPENPAFYDFLSAREYLHFTGRAFGMEGGILNQRIDEVLKLVDMDHTKKRPMRGFSKGMIQRLGIAQALLHDPDLLILDEPMSGLDPLGRALVKNIILDLKSRGKAIFFSTHITSDVETVCDRVGILKKGNLVCVKNVKEFLDRGISGYQIRLHNAVSEQAEEIIVEKEKLADFLAAADGKQIALIEPVRKHLEELFLDIVGTD